MSFILDALKKSELERQRQTVPGLMDSGAVPARPRFPRWAVALLALLAVNLAVLLVVLTRAGGPAAHVDPPAAGTADRPAAANPAAVPAEQHFSPMDAAPVYAPEVPAAGGPVITADSTAPTTRISPTTPISPSAPISPPAARVPHRHDPLLTDDDSKAQEEVLPSMSEINLAGQEALPDLHLDVHVFATQAADRFVYINMRKYHEGSTLQEGPVLERIRRDGVVLNFHGVRFLLPRRQ
jgi:general secretion pathway protein B